jgi:hypothetical protein
MTPEELDEARAKEAVRLFDHVEDGYSLVGHSRHTIANIAARLAREGWTPPEPVDPDVLAFREWGARRFGANTASAYRLGDCDDTAIAHAYLAGARVAREQEQERARYTLAKYRGEA